jgi:hypothetical protein
MSSLQASKQQAQAKSLAATGKMVAAESKKRAQEAAAQAAPKKAKRGSKKGSLAREPFAFLAAPTIGQAPINSFAVGSSAPLSSSPAAVASAAAGPVIELLDDSAADSDEEKEGDPSLEEVDRLARLGLLEKLKQSMSKVEYVSRCTALFSRAVARLKSLRP